MPLYEYECSDCGTVFDRFYLPKGGRRRYYYDAAGKLDDDYPRQLKCNCGGSAKRLISAPSIQDNALTPWMRNLIGTRDNPGNVVDNSVKCRIETRADFNAHCKANKIRIHRAG